MIELEVENGHHMILYTCGEVAKMLALKDVDGRLIGRNRFMAVLRYNKILTKENTPNQYYLNMGLAVQHKTTKRWKSYALPTFTEKGINYLENKFKSGKLVVHFVSKKINKYTIEPNEVF